MLHINKIYIFTVINLYNSLLTVFYEIYKHYLHHTNSANLQNESY